MHQRPVGSNRQRDYMVHPTPTGRDLALERSTKAATGNGLLMPSHTAYWALLVLPYMAWLLAAGAGVLHFDGIPADKRAVHHELMWFDRNVFRTAAGPALAFLVLLLRWLVVSLSAYATAKRSVSSAEGRGASLGVTPHTELAHVSASSTTTAHSAGDNSGAQVNMEATASTHVQVRGLPQPTLTTGCFFRYALVAGQRMLLYGMHMATIHIAATRNKVGIKDMPSYLSDHLLLGASVVSCLQVELICSVSDLTKLDVLGLPLIWHVLTCCGWSRLSDIVMPGVTDMYFTAKFFHHPQESLVALFVGATMLQGPILWWLHRRKYTVCESSSLHERS